MNKKQQITKVCSIFLICLALVSTITLFATPFMKAFEIKLGIIKGSETGMDYITNMFDLDGDRDDDSSGDGWYDDESSDYTLIEEDIEKWIMRGLVAMLLFCAVINFFRALASFSASDRGSSMGEMLSVVKTGFGFNIAYYVFCMYIILKGHDWDFESVLTGDALVTTQALGPMIIQIILFVVSTILYKSWVSGKIDSYFHFEESAPAAATATTGSGQPQYQTSNTTRSARSEMEALELLKKYKELLDNGIITEEEFNAKKKGLLETNSNDNTSCSGNHQADASQAQTSGNYERNDSYASQELSRTCHKCGYPLTSSQQVCPHCGTQWIKTETEAHGMKWYKFLIYFALFGNAILNAIGGIMCFTGANYGRSADLVYEVFPAMKIVDLTYGAALIGLAILALVTRSALAWNKRKGPRLLFAMYILNALAGVVYAFVASGITGELLFDASVFIPLIVSIVMVAINYNYFKKRRDMFTW